MKNLITTLKNIWKIEDLKTRILVTLGFILIYRLGSFVVLPGVDTSLLDNLATQTESGLLGLLNLFTGGAFAQASIFALGIMPYISASIVIQLLGVAVPYFQKLQREGESGRRKINNITRYLTILITAGQAPGYIANLQAQLPAEAFLLGPTEFWLSSIIILVTGTMFFSHTDIQSLVGTLGMFGIAALRLLPTGNALISSLIQLRFQRNTVSRLYNDLVWINQLNFESPRRVFNPKSEEFRHLILEKVRFSYPKTFDEALSGISLKIKAGESIGLVGPSGSGKTSFAFETLYAEGQRRYIKSLSSFARQFVKQMPKPKAELIEGLCPAIAIEQKPLQTPSPIDPIESLPTRIYN